MVIHFAKRKKRRGEGEQWENRWFRTNGSTELTLFLTRLVSELMVFMKKFCIDIGTHKHDSSFEKVKSIQNENTEGSVNKCLIS